MITGNEPIQPVYSATGNPSDEGDIPYLEGRKVFIGLTKREHFAALAMQGLADNDETPEQISVTAVQIADALINALNSPLK